MRLLYDASYQSTIQVFLQEPFTVIQERVQPRTFYKGFCLEPLEVPPERWNEEHFKVLLRIFFLRVYRKLQEDRSKVCWWLFSMNDFYKIKLPVQLLRIRLGYIYVGQQIY